MPKIGLIGAGHLGKIHLRLLREIPEWEVVGIYDTDALTAQKVAEDNGIPNFSSLEVLINEVDALDIVTPTLSHFTLAKKGLEAGKHVFIEKPVTNTPAEALELISLAASQNLIGQVGHVERFNPAFLALEGKTLNPVFIEVHRLAIWNPRGTDVSVVLDLMIHDLDIILSLVSSPVKHISASGIPVISETPDIANARIEFENGCIANLTASRVSMKNMRKVRLFQPNHYVSVDFLEKQTEVIRLAQPGEEDAQGKMIMPFDTGKATKEMVIELLPIQPINAIKMELQEFAASVMYNQPVRVSFNDGYRALKTACDILDCMNNHARKID